MADIKPQDDMAGFVGPWIVGAQVSEVLCGIIIVQAWKYFSTYRDDHVFIRLAVGITSVLNVVSAGLEMNVIWTLSITNFGDYDAVEHIPDAHLVSVILSSFSTLIIQSFFAYRSWKAVQQNVIFGVIMILLALVAFIGQFCVGVLRLISSSVSTLGSVSWAIYMWLWGSAIADVVISAVLITQLVRSSKNSITITDRSVNLINQALRVILTTASATSAFALTEVLAYIFNYRKTNVHTAFAMNVPRLFSISLLYTLNSRENMRENHKATFHSSELTRAQGDPAELDADGNEVQPKKRMSRLNQLRIKGNNNLTGQVVVHQTQEISVTRLANLVREYGIDMENGEGFQDGPNGFSFGNTAKLDPMEAAEATDHQASIIDLEAGRQSGKKSRSSHRATPSS